MPTELPTRRAPPQEDGGDPGFRNVMVAGAILLMVLGLLVEQRLPPTPGYSLAQNAGDLQLSP